MSARKPIVVGDRVACFERFGVVVALGRGVEYLTADVLFDGAATPTNVERWTLSRADGVPPPTCPACGSIVEIVRDVVVDEPVLKTGVTGLARRARPVVVLACTGCERVVEK